LRGIILALSIAILLNERYYRVLLRNMRRLEPYMIPNRIKAERVLINLKQVQLAQLLNVSRDTISSWERGSSNIPSSAVRKMATEIFECSADWLIGISNMRTKNLVCQEHYKIKQ
jgi:transcriptional regulator with XRE-family HTH domain